MSFRTKMRKIGPKVPWKGCPRGSFYRFYKPSIKTNFKHPQLFEIPGQKYLKLQIYVILDPKKGKIGPKVTWKGCPRGSRCRFYKPSINNNSKHPQLFEIPGEKYLKLQIYVILNPK